ncbi:MAG: dehydrogenase [Candidatus Omnitrophota bacterium]|nr:MAG: dehydrogenase [Candidatus Omnitrophota bacterium]
MNIRARAPLRIGLAGGGTDLSPYSDIYGGAILNAAISMYAYVTIVTEDIRDIDLLNNNEQLNAPVEIEFVSADRKEKFSCLIDHNLISLEINGDFDLHKGAFNRLLRDYRRELIFALNRITKLEITTYVDAPAGSGLGSSSTLLVTILGAFREWLKFSLDEYQLAHLAYEIERIDLGMAGGKQDQCTAAFGGFNFMEFYKDNRVVVNPLRIKQEYLNELEFNIVLFYTGTSRLSSRIIEAQIKNADNNISISLEAMHGLKQQAILMKEAILKGRFYQMGELLDTGWQYKKRTALDVTSSLINKIYSAARQAGASGGKISGAGGGGFMILYCPGNTRYKVINRLQVFEGEFRRYHFVGDGLITWRADRKQPFLKAVAC